MNYELKTLIKAFGVITIFLISGKWSLAQPYVQLGAGYSTLNYATGELAAGYRAGPIFIQGGYIAHITRNVDGGAVINARLGTRVFLSERYFIEPSSGYAWHYRSSERKELNTQSWIGSMYLGKIINDNALLMGINYTDKVWMATVIIRYNFK